ncbi:hypothetical protein Y032_0217g2405 [Ancylostoma ceylanicum]|uniref:Uncharacterized protein n=1 Tax=Ancylostoma ceylanicum TaxID=53326 RepID=A0A016SJX0_9BILA|nr:hypothetical protein Y032_0217g2405 [Ancylostoma ceylanicum]
MRLLLLLIALGAVVTAELSGNDIVRHVLKSWNPNRPVNHVHDEDHSYSSRVIKDRHTRSKRSVASNSYISASKSCNMPGYTGEFCEFPICMETNQNVPDVPESDGMGASIDGAVIANCSQQYVVFVDETMYWTSLYLESESPVNPRFTLQGEDGSFFVRDEVFEQTPSSYGARFDFLPPGQYLVTPAADLQTSYCHLTMRARTDMTLQGGFLLGSGNMERSDYPNSRYTYFEQSAPVAIHVNRMRSPASLNAIKFVGEDNMFYRPKLLQKRYNCSYEFIFESFYCNQKGYFYYQVEGISFQGYVFRRIQPFNCIVNPNTTPAPSTTPAPTPPARCRNGGVLVKGLDGTSYCYCVGLFSGADCEQRLCANGGTTTPDNTCQCPDGYEGSHCENVICSDNAGLEFNPNQPTLTFVIRTRQQLSGVIMQATQAIANLVDDLTFDSDYIKAYVLVLFNNGKMILSQKYDSFGDMEIDLLKAEHTADTNGSCTDAVFANTAAALQRYLTYKSPVYILTDALPNDDDSLESVFHVDSYWRVPLNFIYLEPAPDSDCVTTIENRDYRAMDSLAKRTGGMTYYFPYEKRDYFGDFLYQHMFTTVYRSQLLLSNDLPVCANQNVYNPVSVDIAVEQMVIVATGRNLSLVLTTPEGGLTQYDTVYNDGTNYIWVKNGPYTGNWLISMWTSEQTLGCNYKVFQKSYHAPTPTTTQYDLFWGVVQRLDTDEVFLQPYHNVPQSIVMHLTNYRLDSPPERVHAALTVRAIRDNRPVTVFNTNGEWRDGCSYNFYFPPMQCKIPDEILYFNFFVRDSFGFAVQRAGVMYCAQVQPTPEPPPHQCQNGGIINAANTTCFCPPGFTGTYCQQIVCYNGGTPAGQSACQCPTGWTGAFCELAKCTDRGADPEFMRTNVDMVFILELTEQAHAQVYYLNTVFADLIRDVQSQDAQWITRYIIAGYNSTWADVMYESPSRDPAGVVAFMNQLAQQVPTDKGCLVQLWRAVDHVSRRIRFGSYVEIFTASPQDQSMFDNFYTAYENARGLAVRVNAFVNVFDQGFACNATYEDFNTLSYLTSSTTGYNYPLHPFDVPTMATRLIPIQFSSGIVYSQYQDNCMDHMQMFFPIDAYAQTIQLNAIGFNKTVKIFDGNGNEQPSMVILSDPTTGWDILEVRKQCDKEWDQVDQYCIRFEARQFTYDEADRFCHDAGGSLIDDLSEAKHKYLLREGEGFDFWIGLTNPNGTGWVWDRPDGTPMLPLTKPTYWVGDVTQPVYDPNQKCVFWDGNQDNTGNTWTPGSCSKQRAFACQKHRYDPDHQPNSIGDVELPAGKWYATVKVASTTQPWCFVQVRLQSDLQVVTGYVTSVNEDQPGLDPIGDSANNRLVTYVHSLDNEHRTPVLTHALLNDAYNATFYNAVTYSARAACSYPWASQTFSCPNGAADMNELTVTHIGEDVFGNLFQRVTLAHCSKEVITCNGGVRWQGQCICTEYWTGKQCNIPICVNGGKLSPDNRRCECPNGYAGMHCEIELCLNSTKMTLSPDYKTFILVVETTSQNKPVAQALVQNLSSIVTGVLQNNANWFSNYALVTYDSTGVTSQYYQYTSIGALVMGLNSAVGRITDPGNCSLPLYGTLVTVLNHFGNIASPNSEMFVFTSAGVSDVQIRPQLSLLGELQTHFTYFYASDTCGSTPNDGSLTQTARLAYASSGNVLFANSTQLTTVFANYMPTLYGSYVLTNPTGHQFQCANGKDWFIEVEFATTSVYVTTTAAYGTLGVINPMNANITPTVITTAGRTTFYKIDVDRLPGIYTLTLTSPGDCYVHVYGVGGAKVYYDFASPTPTDTSASHQDGYYGYPETGVASVVTLHADALIGTVLKQIELFDPDTQQILMRSALYPRGNCNYEYYSDVFTCNSEAVAMFVYGEDNQAQPFRRQEITYCVDPNTLPTTTKPPATAAKTTARPLTQPATTTTVKNAQTTKGVVTPAGTTGKPVTTAPPPPPISVDVVVLIDISQSAQNTYDDMSLFVLTLMQNFSVSQAYARVAVVPVFGDASLGPLVIANLDAISSQSMLSDYLRQTNEGYNDFDDQGQALAQALNAAINPSFKSAGYRSTISNHLILYITATSGFSAQAQTTAQQVLQSGGYGIVTVGYGPGVTDLKSMQAVAGGNACSFYGADKQALLNQVPAVQALITAAGTNRGKYCGN